MKKLDTSAISASVGMPLKGGSLLFLQQSYQEILNALALSLAGASYNPATPYVVFGLVDSVVGSTHTITSGAILLGGEVFLVPGATITLGGGQVIVLNVNNTFFLEADADPVTFTDNTPRNVHQIRQYALAGGTSGSGAFDFSTLNRVYPNINTGNLGNLQFQTGTVHVGDIPTGGIAVAVAFAFAFPNTNYFPIITILSNSGSPVLDATVTGAIESSTIADGGFTVYCDEGAGGIQDVSIRWMAIWFG